MCMKRCRVLVGVLFGVKSDNINWLSALFYSILISTAQVYHNTQCMKKPTLNFQIPQPFENITYYFHIYNAVL